MRTVVLVYTLVLLCFTVPGWAQPEQAQDNVWYGGLKSHIGFIIPHDQTLREVSASNPWGVNVEVGKVLKSERAWATCNCFSKVGLSAYHFNYRNPRELGSSTNLVFFGEPFLGFNTRAFLSLRGGIGVSYLSKVYNEDTNPRNQFFSAPLSFIGLINVGFNYRVEDTWVLQLAASYNHISNGGSREPNKGMNFPTVSLGVEKHLQALKFPSHPRQPGLRQQPWRRYAYLAGARHVVKADAHYPTTGHPYLGLEGGVMRAISNINALSVGAELYYDDAQTERARRGTGDDSPFLASLTAGHALVFGRFSFTQQLAYEVYRPTNYQQQAFFQRYAIYYQLGRWLSVGTSMKVHGHVADFMDVRIGARW
jgi:hypothetical protein